MTDERKCENCVYWLDYEKDGVCRRYPPTVLLLDDEPDTLYPVVNRNWWCGEFKPRQEGGT